MKRIKSISCTIGRIIGVTAKLALIGIVIHYAIIHQDVIASAYHTIVNLI